MKRAGWVFRPNIIIVTTSNRPCLLTLANFIHTFIHRKMTLTDVYCLVCTLQGTVYSVHFAMYSVQCTLCNVQCTVYSTQFTVYNVHCKLYTIHCTIYKLHNVPSRPSRPGHTSSSEVRNILKTTCRLSATHHLHCRLHHGPAHPGQLDLRL